MKAKILFIPCLHKRDVDFSSIKGYTKAIDAVQDDIISFIKTQGVTHLISMGDWYDKGYRHIGRHSSDDNYDREISAAVNGNAYITVGNHMYIERDQNPEMYMIQPNEKFKPLHPIHATSPIFHAVDDIVIGTVQISFFHFDRENKLYINDRKPGVTYHIGVYHDDTVVPSSVRQRAGYTGHTSTEYLETIFSNVDFAIVGHIHVKIGVETLHLNNGRKVPMIIPGALAIVQNKDSLKHKEVMLPVITIDDENKTSCKLYPFSTHMELLKFYNTTVESKPAEGVTQTVKESIQTIQETSVTLKEYMRKIGYGENYLAVLDKAGTGTLDLISAIKLFTEEIK